MRAPPLETFGDACTHQACRGRLQLSNEDRVRPKAAAVQRERCRAQWIHAARRTGCANATAGRQGERRSGMPRESPKVFQRLLEAARNHRGTSTRRASRRIPGARSCPICGSRPSSLCSIACRIRTRRDWQARPNRNRTESGEQGAGALRRGNARQAGTRTRKWPADFPPVSARSDLPSPLSLRQFITEKELAWRKASRRRVSL
jgi:hypothetical protein